MKENFTATQKEVVARKMGYDGPMQMFDEFLMSRPSDAQRYASITSKFAENMAKGGVVGYKNLAAKGRNGDTMLAHITPEEAALLKARGGAGTINPDTGLREFYGMAQYKMMQEQNLFPALEPLPTLGQALAPETLADIPAKLELVTPPAQSYRGQSAAITPATPQVAPEYSQYADRGVATGMGGGRQVEGYTIPVEQTFAGKPLVAQYDAQGNFKQLTLERGQYLTPDPSQPNIQSVPTINAKGEVIDFGIVDVNNLSGNGLGSMISELATEFAPMIITALGANLAAGNLGFGAGAAGGATAADIAASNALAQANLTGYAGTAFSAIPSGVGAGLLNTAVGTGSVPLGPYVSQAAGAYGGSTAAANAAAAGSLSGIQAAKLAQDALTAEALARTGITYGGNVTPADIPTTQAPTTPEAPTGPTTPTPEPFVTPPPVTPITPGDVFKGVKNVLTPSGTEEEQPRDVSSAVAFLIDLLGKRNPSTRGSRSYAVGGAVEPTSPSATTGTASTTTLAPGMTAAATPAGTTTAAAPSTAVTSTDVSTPSAITEDKITTDAAQTKLVTSLTGVSAEQGIVSEGAKAAAATVVPTATEVGKEPAAQGVATQVVAPQKRTEQAKEIVSGSAVDQKQVEEALAKTQAAQGVVTEEMTTQGQLNKLLTNFDAGNPPPWAAASMRGATAQLAARGLGVSSMAGQAIVQATLEAALPIAATDAKVFEQMGLQNLSNRQQTAMILGEQRAKFLGQEFDQNFQTKVLNAARIADIADKNFTADVTIALENARITGTMDLQNLSNKQALVLAKTAQVANLETTNLNNKQQVAVENAKAFLTLDVKNLDNKQQTALFKAKEIADSIITDTAAANAAKATNAANALEVDKINAQLALSASQYNTAEKNKVAMFNKSAADELTKFNTQETNNRAEFNANLSTQISIANAKLLADVSTANTRETNAMAAVNAKNATDLSASTYAQLSQTYRDQLETAWKTSDNVLMRANEISKVTLTTEATKYAGDAAADAAYYSALGSLSASLLTSSGGSKIVSSVFDKAADTVLGWLK